MARVCEICGKGPITGVVVNGVVRRIRVCTQCIKSNRVAKAS